MGAADDRIVDELRKFVTAFFPPISKHHSKAEKKSLASSAANFVDAATTILTFIQTAKISQTEKSELKNCFFLACAACQQHSNIVHGAIERLGDEIKKLPPKRRKFTPKIIK